MKTMIIDSKVDGKAYDYIPEILKAKGESDLPDNVMLNKVTTGSGMTTVALISPQPYVIAVPNTNLIKSKLYWAEQNNIDLLGVYAYSECGIGEDEIESFTGDKIMVTYDSLYKVTNALEANGRINEFKIMIDESHLLIQAGGYRANAINSLLEVYKKFPKFIFGTATPVEDKYQLPELREIPKAMIKWYKLQPVNVNYCVYYEGLLDAVAIQAIKHLDGEMEHNAHFFINSVEDIVVILRLLKRAKKLRKDSIKIVTANNRANEYKLKSVSNSVALSDINEGSKKINFYTSTAFQGCDLSDPNGLIYVVSDGSKNHAKIDICTTLPQIIGRIRDTKYSTHVNFMYSPNRYYSHTTEEEFEATTKAQLALAAKTVEDYNTLQTEKTKELLLKGAKDDIFLSILIKDNKKTLIVNNTALYAEMQNFNTVHTLYYHTAKERKNKTKVGKIQIVHNDITYEYEPAQAIDIKGLDKAKLNKVISFKALCKQYKTANADEKATIAEIYPIIAKAYNILGESTVGTCNYQRADIERELVKTSTMNSVAWKVANLLDYRVGEFIPAKDAKFALQDTYKDLGIDKKAKGTDLAEYYEITNKSMRIDGKKVKGYVIVAKKFKNIEAHRESPVTTKLVNIKEFDNLLNIK